MNKKIYFIHIPRCGGTFINQSFSKSLGSNFVREGHTTSKKHLVNILDRYGPAHYTTVNKNDCITIAVIRNPFDLLVSMYRWGFPYFAPFDKSSPYYEWPFLSFRDFVHKFLKNDCFPWKVKAQRKSLFFQLHGEKGEFLPDYILKLETIKEGVDLLNNEIKTNIKLLKDRVNISRNDDYKEYYDSQTIKLVNEKFNCDLKNFNYCFDNHNEDSLVKINKVLKEKLHYKNYFFKKKKFKDNFFRNKRSTLADKNFHDPKIDFLDNFPFKEIIFYMLTKIKKKFLRF